MNYKEIYESIITRGKARVIDGYTESHHIVPRCLGGNDEIENLVDLTPEEHYVAHQLLVKMYPNNHRLAMAAMMMTAQRPGNKIYGWLRRRHSNAMSIKQSGKGNSQYGTRWIYNTVLQESKKIPKDDPLPNGWLEGRKLSFISIQCGNCGEHFVRIKLENFCSDKCKLYYKSPQYKIIDDNIEYILSRIKEIGSISAVLRDVGITGNKIGNSYVSKIAKSRGIKILRRRNTRS